MPRDLGLESISFSKKELLAGETVRLYARVVNYGQEDEIAYVTFWQGGLGIGNSQPVSLRAGGFPDEVFVNYLVPDQPFNIRAVVKGQEAGDQNPANDELVTGLITPLPDRDRDRLADSLDNCPEVANADQLDTDGDKLGDVCDLDDDQDGLADEEEIQAGTDPRRADTDGDGVSDRDDVFPLDPLKSKKIPPPPPPPSATHPVPTPEILSEINPSSETVTPSEITTPLRGMVGEGDLAPPPSVEGGGQGGGEPEPQIAPVETDQGFWNFGNPLLKGLIGLLVVGAGGLLIAERKITRKYNALIASEFLSPLSEESSPADGAPAPKRSRRKNEEVRSKNLK
ncbi:thrombospondin type 3 repeat-containing protein [Candidatus Uhrbacteria bacterium]|nr:thrombospondin type 3 repeat-containing protein [Candidatus Uhrbacteria bacterium]